MKWDWTDEEIEQSLARAHAADVAHRMPATRAWMAADIAAHLAEIENRNEFTRVAEEDAARRATAQQAKKERAQVERVLTEKRRKAAAELELSAKDRYTPVLGNGKKSVRGVFDFDTWTWDAQWDLWEDQLKPEAHAKLAGDSTQAKDPKAELLLFYLEKVLPTTTEKGAVFPVLFFLLKLAPEDLGSFKTSHQEIAKGSGAGVRSVQRAIAFLEEKNLLAVNQEAWSPKKSSRAEYVLCSLEKLRHTPTWLESAR
jgi:hypothetical protein